MSRWILRMACMLALVAVTGLPVAAAVCAAVCAPSAPDAGPNAGHHGRHATSPQARIGAHHQPQPDQVHPAAVQDAAPASASTSTSACHRPGLAGGLQLTTPSHDCAKHDEAAVEAGSVVSRADDGVGAPRVALVPAFLLPPALGRLAGLRSDGPRLASPARPLGATGQLILRI